jgi:hypothetical protein
MPMPNNNENPRIAPPILFLKLFDISTSEGRYGNEHAARDQAKNREIKATIFIPYRVVVFDIRTR